MKLPEVEAEWSDIWLVKLFLLAVLSWFLSQSSLRAVAWVSDNMDPRALLPPSADDIHPPSGLRLRPPLAWLPDSVRETLYL